MRTESDLSITILILMVLLTFVRTPIQNEAIIQASRLATGILFFLSIINWTKTYSNIYLLAKCVVYFSIFLAFSVPFIVDWQRIGLLNKVPIIPVGIYTVLSRFASDVANPNVIAGALAILLPIPFAKLLFANKRTNLLTMLFNLTSFVLLSLMLLLTQSRGALISAVVASLIMMSMRSKRMFAIIAFVGIGSTAWLVIPLLLSQSTIRIPQALASALLYRAEIWSRALTIIGDYPIIGRGMGSFHQSIEQAYPLFINPPDTPHAHNLYLQVALDTGVLGLIAWLAILLTSSTSAWQLYQYGLLTGKRQLASIGAGLFCSNVALVTHGFTDAVTWGMVRTAIIPWALWGIAIASYRTIHASEGRP